MNIWDWLILAALILALIPAVRKLIISRNLSCSCCSDCPGCGGKKTKADICPKAKTISSGREEAL